MKKLLLFALAACGPLFAQTCAVPTGIQIMGPVSTLAGPMTGTIAIALNYTISGNPQMEQSQMQLQVKAGTLYYNGAALVCVPPNATVVASYAVNNPAPIVGTTKFTRNWTVPASGGPYLVSAIECMPGAIGCVTTPNVAIAAGPPGPAGPAVSGTGAVVVTSGVVGLAPGASTNCVLVDGTSSTCGAGGGATIPSTTDLISGDGAGNGADSGIAPATLILNSGSYANPAWIASLAWAKLTGVPAYEPAITAGTTLQYWRGDKIWRTFTTDLWANLSATGPLAFNAATGAFSCSTCLTSSLVSSVFGRTGAVVATSGDYTTAQVTEATNLYFTNARAQAAMSGLYEVPLAFGAGLNRSTNTITVPALGVTNAMLAGSIAWAKLAQSDVVIPAAQTTGFAAVATSGSASDLGTGTLPNARIVSLPNANLANPATTVLGTTCTLGSTCTPTASLTANVSGVLPAANGGTAVANTATLTLGTSNQSWATLGTGIVKNTTTTGALSDAASADIIGLFTGCSGTMPLGADGACHSGGGGATIASVTNLIKGDGAGNGSDSGIAPAAVGLVANPLSQFAATTSAQLASTISDETGTGAAVFATSPALVTPTITTSAVLTSNALATTPAGGYSVTNSTAAATGAQQVSPPFTWTGQGWKTTATAASQSVAFQAYVLPVQGTAAPGGQLTFATSINGGASTPVLRVNSNGSTTVPGIEATNGASSFGTGITSEQFRIDFVAASGLQGIINNSGDFIVPSSGGYEFGAAAATSAADTTITRSSAGLVAVNGGIASKGTKFTTSGCSVSATSGGATAGSLTLGANTCTVTLTLNGATGLTAPNGWSCYASDITAGLVIPQNGGNATTCTLAVPVTAGTTDVIVFHAMAY